MPRTVSMQLPLSPSFWRRVQDVYVHGPAFSVKGIAPDFILKLGTGIDHAPMFQQKAQNFKFL